MPRRRPRPRCELVAPRRELVAFPELAACLLAPVEKQQFLPARTACELSVGVQTRVFPELVRLPGFESVALPGHGSVSLELVRLARPGKLAHICVCLCALVYVRTCVCVCPEPVCLARPGKLAHICVFLCSFVCVRTCLCVCPELLRLANRMCSCALSTHALRSTGIRMYFGIVLVISHAYTYALTDVLAWFPCIAVWLKHQA